MAAVTHRVTTTSTTDTDTYATGSFTPAADELLVAMVAAADTVDDGEFTDSDSLGWARVETALLDTSAHKLYLFVANKLARAVSMTGTFSCAGDTAAGALITIAGVSGMQRLGAAAVRQTTKQENQPNDNSSPAPVFAQACLAANPVGQAIALADSGGGMIPPSGWTELNDVEIATPILGLETNKVDSGFTGTAPPWTDTVGANFWAIVAFELDTTGTASLRNPDHSQFPKPKLRTPTPAFL